MRAHVLVVLCAGLLAAAAPQQLGNVRFANSGAAGAQPAFQRGVALLHSYEYADAHDAFAEARRIDKTFALAAWLQALTFSHFDWGTEDLPQAQRTLATLAATLDGRMAMARTPREREFGAAIEAFLSGDGTPLERARGLSKAMEAWSANDPADVEAAAFAARAALYVLQYAPPGEQIAAAEHAIALARGVLAKAPQHPGGVHYLIHATDSPRFAADGLPAARAYDKIAPDADHALHMPSHIFLQLGMWDDVVASNVRAWNASRASVKRAKRPETSVSWHSLAWLQYRYLQQGRFDAARNCISTAKQILDAVPAADLQKTIDAQYALDTLRFQYALDADHWDAAEFATRDVAGLFHEALAKSTPRERSMAINAAYHASLAAALTANPADAEATAAANRRVVDALKPQDSQRMMLDGMASQIDALAAAESGEADKAIALLTQREALVREMGATPLGPPAVFPTSEMLGRVLLKAGRHAEAAAAYERALTQRANRSAALLGLARAKAAAGDTAGAAAAYRRLLQNWKQADKSPALDEARAAISGK